MLTQFPDKVQILSGGKRDDIAHAIDPSKQIFLFNVPRGGMEYLQYTILEQIKDRMVFSPKYNSQTKILRNRAHVVVFSNEMPDIEKMTHDRYDYFEFGDIAN
uniref:Putative replication-associated protein n=1 Tax=uncultured virus TaxID=340016 RepID=A0A2H4YQ41_9VIRU|nr:putative replication-associated protein [uncultured virus]